MEAHAFHPHSRVWVYTSSRLLSGPEVLRLSEQLNHFCENWTAHNQQLFAQAYCAHQRYVIFVVDETQAGASGCSIDKSVHFLQKAGQTLGCDFFVRNLVAYKTQNEWEWVDFKSIPSLIDSQHIDASTLVLDTTVTDFQGLMAWEKPLAESWMKRYLKHVIG